jgi:hypothetical protein
MSGQLHKAYKQRGAEPKNLFLVQPLVECEGWILFLSQTSFLIHIIHCNLITLKILLNWFKVKYEAGEFK